MVNNDYLLRNPCAKLDAVKYEPAVREPLTALQLEEVRWNCKNIREKAIIDFLFSTGLRISECSNVKLSDINWPERSVDIPHGKGDKHRIVFFNAESEFTLRKYLATRTDDVGYLFITSKGEKKKLEVRSLQNIVRKIGKRCGLHTYPHRFRHTFATHGIQSGMPLNLLQALMGHANTRTTLGYAKNDITDLKLSHRKSFS
jgi:integrase/recombinase XerD